ncbi:MAG TPA: DegT/DnrJ/EryC1/StrS family aminotransferase [Thermoanaerobaculia bacterium]|nr:DegT/DnrJ/EryC1/StrS family aminotransferase [Thermoanaerobaculia bacterium]
MVEAVSSRLAIHGGEPAVTTPGPHFRWPLITDETRQAVLRQLDEAVSLYDRSGVVARLEQRLEAEYALPHALLFNTGTSALLAMFIGAGLAQGDEVLCPDYTFFASNSPLFFTGAIPVLVDCDRTGNMDPARARELVTARTRAILVTHLWGVPCDMDPLVELCREHGLLLLEDISHAHGATYKGQPVGTFGHAAALSLQAQKTLTGGEGGVLLTRDDEIFYRALALGHYTKRCLQEIPEDHLLHAYGVTGLGLKLRIHPLAAAIAEQQLDTMPAVLAGRRRYAHLMRRELSAVPGLELPPIPEGAEPSWYGLIFHLDRELARRGLSGQVLAALAAEGCSALDHPKVTAPVHRLPLFREPGRVFPGYASPPEREFPMADEFYARAWKLPVWHREEDGALVGQYLEAIRKVMHHFSRSCP